MSTSAVEQRAQEEQEIFSKGKPIFEVEPVGREEMNLFTSLLEESTGVKVRWFCEESSNGEIRFIIVALGDLEKVRTALATTFQPLIEILVQHARLGRMFGGDSYKELETQ